MDHQQPQQESQPKTLYVGNLDPSVTEELILTLFSQIGPVKGCKIIRETGGGDPYCFVEFTNYTSAATALTAMNRRRFLDKELKVNWAASPGSAFGGYQPKVDTSQHHHIFVGDLSPEIDTDALRNTFAPFGEISDCRVVCDLTTGKTKGYGFVSFVNKVDAQTAIEQMNGQFLGSRSIRTNWATRKPPVPGGAKMATGDGISGNPKLKPLNFEEVYGRASEQNFTAYCGGLINVDENFIRRTFSPYGRILEIRYFKDKGYAFIRYDNKESACNAIVAIHGTEVAPGMTVKCSWGKENGANPAISNPYGMPTNPVYGYDPNMAAVATAGGGHPYYQQQQQPYFGMYPQQQYPPGGGGGNYYPGYQAGAYNQGTGQPY